VRVPEFSLARQQPVSIKPQPLVAHRDCAKLSPRYSHSTSGGSDVTSEAALEHQIQRYRAMTGQQRLKIALDLHEFACNVARAGIRHQFPSANSEEIDRHLRRRIQLSRS
jgi:hypothetical protein